MSAADQNLLARTPRPLAGLTAVVTGASSGIGRAIAEELAAGGASVVVHARANRTGAEETAAAIKKLGGEAKVWLGDLADETKCSELVDTAWAWRGAVDVWINNAGADVLTGAAAGESFEQKLARLWQVDVLATLRLSRAAGARMKAQTNRPARPTIINMGWDRTETGMAGESGEMFAAIKGAVTAFTRSLAQSLAPEVRVNCLAPGWIRTAWGEHASDYWQKRAQNESLSGRWGTPEDVARAAAFLASPAADFLNGQVIPVNGGIRYPT